MSYTLAYTGAEIDALLGKIDAIFVAEYGSTIYSEVTAAIAAGNKVIVANAGKVFVYAGTDDNSGYVFTQSGPNAAKPNATYVTLSTGNVWSTATVDLATVQQFYASLMEDTASGSIASFPDGAEGVPVKELTAEIEPIQDLHGQASPYPAGGGKNKLPMTLTGLKSLNTNGSWSGNTYTHNGVTYQVLVDGANNVTGIKLGGTASANSFLRFSASFTLEAARYYLNGANGGASNAYFIRIGLASDNTYIASCFSDADASFTLAADTALQASITVVSGQAPNTTFYPMIRLSTEADATFAPYSNICPISGYTGAEITRTGKNLAYVAPVGNIVNMDALIPVKTGDTLYVYGDFTGGTLWSAIYSEPHPASKDTSMIVKVNTTINSGTVYTANITADGWFGVAYNAGKAGYTINKFMIARESFTAAEYEAYNGTTYSVSWTDHGTIYKGTAHYKGSGEWEISDIYGELDLGTLGWTTNQGAFYYGANAGWKSSADGRCEIYQIIPETAIGSSPNNSVQMRAGGIYIKDARYTVAADFKTAVSGIKLYFEAQTPTAFTVSGPDPETLLGDNNIWSDTGDISVKYRANTALYIEKRLGE